MKGRKITISEKSGARYTSAKVREAIFNILGDVEGKTVLDLFAGSGSFTIEALSRGAASATCVEAEREMVRIVMQNIKSLGLNGCCDVMAMDVASAIPLLSKKVFSYDIVFMDPPYEKGYIGKTMELLKTYNVCGAGTLLVMEHSKRETQTPSNPEEWRQIASKEYGDTVVTIFQTHSITRERST